MSSDKVIEVLSLFVTGFFAGVGMREFSNIIHSISTKTIRKITKL